jgi:hypothetical protein
VSGSRQIVKFTGEECKRRSVPDEGWRREWIQGALRVNIASLRRASGAWVERRCGTDLVVQVLLYRCSGTAGGSSALEVTFTRLARLGAARRQLVR